MSMRDQRTVRPLLLALAMALAPTADGIAQPATASPNAGALLRVWSPVIQQGRPLVGTLLRSDSTQLQLDLGNGTVAYYPWPQIDSLEVSRGRTGGQGRRFAFIGAVGGGVLLAALAAAGTDEGDVIDPGAAAGVAFLGGAGLGALIGATIGSARAHEQWESVPLRARIGFREPQGSRRITFAVTVARFR
jgi:hypothetical protein